MDISHSAFRERNPRKHRLWSPVPPESHSCQFCQSLQAQCLSEPGLDGFLKLNVTARDVLHNIENECYCDFVALMASIWKTTHPSRTPRCGDISTDILFPMSGSDKIPDEIRSREDDFIFILTSGWRADNPPYGVPHDIASIDGFGFRHALSGDSFRWFFSKPLLVYTTADDPASKCITSRPINTCPDGEETHTLARNWLSSCISGEGDHADWCKPPVAKFVPTRLLEIRCHPTRSTFLTKLVQPTRPTLYAALSYCWGGEQPHKTTGIRLEAYRTCIAWRVLPQSIRDAVKVTFELGLRYLWVDAFCIIQDDAIDAAREIAQMPHIYAESTVTIVASRASKSTEGFLHDIQPRTIAKSTFKLPLKCSDGSVGSICLMSAKDVAFETILETRGWALQEWSLSPRILDYNVAQVHWHCAASMRKVNFTNGWRQFSKFNGSTIYEEFRQRIEESTRGVEYDGGGGNSNGSFALRVWRSFVNTYTQRNLTILSDRILAISGLAERCGVIHPDRYLAGLWQRSIEDDLLWKRDHFSDPKPSDCVRPAIFQGPSWSWTGINGAVSLRSRPGSSQVSLIDADIRLVESRAVYGAVKSGVLRLRGRVRLATWNGDNKLYHWNGPLLRFNALADCDELDAPWDPAKNGASVKNVSFEIYLLLVRSNERFDKKRNITLLEHAGLILHRNQQCSVVGSPAAGKEAHARFSRLGQFDSMSHDNSISRPSWTGPELRGMETHAFFDRCLDQVIELE